MSKQLGLRKHVSSSRDIQLADVYTSSTPPENAGASGLNWQMFGNDKWGDCFWASSAHEGMAEAYLSGRTRVFTEASVVTYSYVPYLGLHSLAELTSRTDLGTDARQGALWRQKHGVIDANGKGDKIGAFFLYEEPDYQTILSATYDLEGGTLCVNLPYSAEEAFDRGSYVWDYKAGSQIAGGHAIAQVGIKDGQLNIVSWGHEVIVTEAFIEKYLQCVVFYVSAAALNGEGKTVSGLDRQGLKNRLVEVQS